MTLMVGTRDGNEDYGWGVRSSQTMEEGRCAGREHIERTRAESTCIR